MIYLHIGAANLQAFKVEGLKKLLLLEIFWLSKNFLNFTTKAIFEGQALPTSNSSLSASTKPKITVDPSPKQKRSIPLVKRAEKSKFFENELNQKKFVFFVIIDL